MTDIERDKLLRAIAHGVKKLLESQGDTGCDEWELLYAVLKPYSFTVQTPEKRSDLWDGNGPPF